MLLRSYAIKRALRLVLILTVGLLVLTSAGCRPSREESGPSVASVGITVTEIRERTVSERGETRGARGSVGPPGAFFGQVLALGFGQVEVSFRLPSSTAPADLRAAITTEPAADVYVADSSTLVVSWPGATISGLNLPDPAELLQEGRAPAGYTLEMTLSIDPAKAPAFKDPAGSGKPWTLTIQRRRPPDFSVSCADNPLVKLPYPDAEDPLLHYLTRERHRMVVSFTKPMARATVEEVLAGATTYEASSASLLATSCSASTAALCP